VERRAAIRASISVRSRSGGKPPDARAPAGGVAKDDYAQLVLAASTRPLQHLPASSRRGAAGRHDEALFRTPEEGFVHIPRETGVPL
jgi:hypothetical protein